jgi:hypothetical protein
MKQDEIIQTAVIFLMQKGINTDELLIRRKEILDKFCTIRAKVLSDFTIRKISVSSRNYQTTYVDKVAYSDDGSNNYGYFRKYPTIMGETSWVGSVDGRCRFREYRTLSEYSSVIKDLVPAISGYYPENDLLKTDNAEVETLRYNALFSSPNEVSTFNQEYDEFPIDDALIPQICEAMYQVYFSKVNPIQPDVINDSTPTPKA